MGYRNQQIIKDVYGLGAQGAALDKINASIAKGMSDINAAAALQTKIAMKEKEDSSKLYAKSSIEGVEFKDSESLNIANAVFEQAAMKIFDQLPVMKPGKVNGVVSSFPFRIPVTYRIESQNFDPNDIFT